MKYTYLAISIKENNLYYSYVLKDNSCNNLLHTLKIKGIENATICNTKKHAEIIVKEWNQAYKENKNYLFQ